MTTPAEDRRCGSCARFVRVVETIDQNGEVKRHGDCLLGVWPSPLYAHNTCSQFVKRGTFTAKPAAPQKRVSRVTRTYAATSPSGVTRHERAELTFELPEELLDMNADEFREILREVIRDELGVASPPLGQRWEGGECILRPGKDGTQEKRIPIETIFSKIVMIRDKLRVLEQKVNAHGKLTAEEKVAMQQYITGCYGSLTTFNVLFANKGDQFIGQRGEE